MRLFKCPDSHPLTEVAILGEMGQELTCRADWAGQSSEGKAQLEPAYILFRGSFRVRAALSPETPVQSKSGILTVPTPDGPLKLHLGDYADKWQQKILNPPSLHEKLGIKPNLAIHLDGEFAADFLPERKAAKAPYDLVFLSALDRAALGRIDPSLGPKGALWIVYPKGRKEITEMDVLNAGRAAGLKDIKVCSFSPTQTALKFTRPKGA